MRPLGSHRRRQLAQLALIFLLGASIRLGHLLAIGNLPLGGDEVDYDALGLALLRESAFTSQPGFSVLAYSPPGQPTAYRVPGLPLALAGVYGAFGHSTLAARVVLGLCSAAASVLVVLLAERTVGSRTWALVAGVVWAVWPASITNASTTILTEPLVVPLSLMALVLLSDAVGRTSLAAASGAGALMGLSSLVRANMTLMLAGGLVLLFLCWRGGCRARFRAALVFGLSGSVVLLPWVYRNYRALGTMALSTQADALFLGNNDWARGSFNGEFYSPRSAQVRYLLDRHPALPSMLDSEKARIYSREALAYAVANPGRMLWLVGRKTILFWVPLQETRAAPRIDWALVLVFPFFLTGAWVALRRDGVTFAVLLLPVAVAYLTCVITFSMPRYRHPAEPTILLLAAIGGRVILARSKHRSDR